LGVELRIARSFSQVLFVVRFLLFSGRQENKNMNWIYIVFTSIALVFSQSVTQQFDKFSSGMTNGNAATITALSGEKMLLKIEGSERSYSRSQASGVLSDFFKKHPAKSFKYSHKTESGQNAIAFGDYQSDERYKVTVQFVKVGSVFKLERLSIE